MSNPTQSWQPGSQSVNPYAAPKVQQTMQKPGSRDPLGGRGERLGAAIVDGIIFAPGIIAMAIGSVLNPDSSLLVILIGLMWYLFVLVAQIVALVKYSGTIGKRMLGLYIANFDNGAPAGWVTTILVRTFLNGLITAIPFFGSLYAFVDVLFIFGKDRRCIHDLIARTVVLKRS